MLVHAQHCGEAVNTSSSRVQISVERMGVFRIFCSSYHFIKSDDVTVI